MTPAGPQRTGPGPAKDPRGQTSGRKVDTSSVSGEGKPVTNWDFNAGKVELGVVCKKKKKKRFQQKILPRDRK